MSQFLLDNLILIAVIVVSAGALFVTSFSKLRSGPGLTLAAATDLINRKDAQIIDLRSPEEFKAGHIANARNIPADGIQKLYEQLDKSRPVLLVDKAEGIARAVVRLLRGVGFSEVAYLEGGMQSWKKEGMPLKK